MNRRQTLGCDPARLVQAWGAWLAPRQWHHFATLTTRYARSENWITKEILRLIRNLERRAGQRIDYMAVLELTTVDHWHALTSIAAMKAWSSE